MTNVLSEEHCDVIKSHHNLNNNGNSERVERDRHRGLARMDAAGHIM